jgi:hypothetical protein
LTKFFGGSTALLFAYGCTGAGKSHTIIGKPHDDDVKGVIPRILEEIYNSLDVVTDYKRQYPASVSAHNRPSFDDYFAGRTDVNQHAMKLDPTKKYALWFSFLEIYNEQVSAR